MDFLDTAAILSNCDLLISSDSAVVHLAAPWESNLAGSSLDPRMALGLEVSAQPVRQRASLPATKDGD